MVRGQFSSGATVLEPEKRVKFNNRASFHHKIAIVFSDNIGLTIKSKLQQFEHIFLFL